jgi:hypothetical protein
MFMENFENTNNLSDHDYIIYLKNFINKDIKYLTLILNTLINSDLHNKYIKTLVNDYESKINLQKLIDIGVENGNIDIVKFLYYKNDKKLLWNDKCIISSISNGHKETVKWCFSIKNHNTINPSILANALFKANIYI